MGKKKKKHFKDPDYFKIKRGRKHPEHIKNCKTGYYRDTEHYRQIHHIVCISSMQDAYIEQQLKGNVGDMMVIRFCLMETDWNINAGHNCVGLPLKPALVGRSPKRWGGWPVHTVDHDHYYEEMHVNLNTYVWQPVLEKAENCEFDRKNLKEELEDRSTEWRKWLKARGQSWGGTKYCWRSRYNRPNIWYIPFSMSPNPRPRKPSPTLKEFSEAFQKAFKALFSIR
jgi:hypothetical protein